LAVDGDGGFVGPGAGDVAGRVAASAEDDHGDVEFLAEGYAGAVALDLQVEAA